MNLCIRNARTWRGEPVDIAIAEGVIAGTGRGLRRRGAEFDAEGATVLPGLHDHHFHIMATAARRSSIDLSSCRDGQAVQDAIARASASQQPGAWLRAVDYDERAAGLPDRAILDGWAPAHRLRVQDRTGALWVLNGSALETLTGLGEWPEGAERDGAGDLTGRFWREDAWLGERLPRALPDLAGFGRELAAMGLTGLTDAGARNGPEQAALLAGAVSQRLTIMGDETLRPGGGFALGPLKLLIDERDPPDLDRLADRIRVAREQRRAVAAHCVTATELALYLCALELAGGAQPGDRIEHGGMIPDAAIAAIRATPLTVVTNPGFIRDRGDRYLETIAQGDRSELYRARSLLVAGIPLAAGSDAPYATADPWIAMRAARDRRTAGGHPLGQDERIPAERALRLYLGSANDPGGPPRCIAAGEAADLILCEGPAEAILADLCADRVRATVVAGDVVFNRA